MIRDQALSAAADIRRLARPLRISVSNRPRKPRAMSGSLLSPLNALDQRSSTLVSYGGRMEPRRGGDVARAGKLSEGMDSMANPPTAPALRAPCLREAQETGNAPLVARRHGLRARTGQAGGRAAHKPVAGSRPPPADPQLQQGEAENLPLHQILGEKSPRACHLEGSLKKSEPGPAGATAGPPRGRKSPRVSLPHGGARM